MPKTTPPLGTRAEVNEIVKPEHTLKAHVAWLPPVLTTPDMIRWMEIACFIALQPFCEDGETTVGTHIDVKHFAPTGIGEGVKAEAELERIDGRFYMMKVTATSAGKVIGSGHVGRAFVHMERFLEKTNGT